MYKLDAARFGSASLFTTLIILTNIIPPLAIDEYTPSMPFMVSDLNTSVAQVQLSIIYYLLAFSISQLVCGVLSDYFGRRIVLLLSMPLFFLGSLFCIFTHNIGLLILGRILQGLGVGGIALTGPALMADCFDGPELTKVSSYYSLIYSFIPITAPVLGGLIQDYFNWRANFLFMFILSIFIYFIFYFKLPETNPRVPSKKLDLGNVLKSYLIILTHRSYMVSVIGLILTWSLFVVFSIMAPFIIEISLGYSASVYGAFAILVGLGFFVGNSINSLLIKKYSENFLLRVSLLSMLIFSIILLSLQLQNYINIYTIMIPVFFIMTAAGISFPHLYASAVGALPEYAGKAGSLIGSLILIGAVIINTIITDLRAHSSIDMAAVYLILSAINLLLCFIPHTKK
ncbi:multidrug effflux MFS transporter [Legionella gresilensis]|uniref:multidrug effflux MFS transporter n=1 Tax=Legionella gresilensis TaxID=91823 RepID=UPI0010417713|nr:multidrug effflux MFS transporter [Legionella gresilensis]